MLVIQHIWTRWTKYSRGANAPVKRPRLEEAYHVPEPMNAVPVIRHEIRALEHENFAPVEELGPVTRDEWERLEPFRDNALDWRMRGEMAEISLRNPSESRLQTRWPSHQPSPLFALGQGETARIEWNGRFLTSMSGQTGSTYYEQHVYWLAMTDRITPRLFLDAEPRKRIDLRAHIY